MSLQFSDTTNRRGIVQLIDDIADTDVNIYSIEEKTRDINLALDRALAIIFQVGGRWNFDDSNHEDYPVISTNIVSGQRDYSFTTDENQNLILDVHKVMAADENGNFNIIWPVDVSSGAAPSNYYDGLNTRGQPNTYDKLSNSIFLDPIPNYNRTGGLKVYISREGSYFIKTDTTKKPGFAGLFHEYLALRPAYQFCYRNGMQKAATLKAEMLEMEDAIREYYKAREKDDPKVIRPRVNSVR